MRQTEPIESVQHSAWTLCFREASLHMQKSISCSGSESGCFLKTPCQQAWAATLRCTHNNCSYYGVAASSGRGAWYRWQAAQKCSWAYPAMSASTCHLAFRLQSAMQQQLACKKHAINVARVDQLFFQCWGTTQILQKFQTCTQSLLSNALLHQFSRRSVVCR